MDILPLVSLTMQAKGVKAHGGERTGGFGELA